MLFTIFSKALPSRNKNISRNPELKEYNNGKTTKNGMTVDQMIRSKYGRKSMLEESKQVNENTRNSPFLYRTIHRSPIQEVKDDKMKQKFTICWRNKHRNEKKRTYSNQYCPQNAQEQAKYYLQSGKDTRRRLIKNSYPINVSEGMRPNLIEKPFCKTKREVQLNFYNNQGQKIEEEVNLRKSARHHRFASVDISQNFNQKVSFIELINKFEFKNLKTTHQKTSSSKNSIKPEKIEADNLQNNFTQKKYQGEQQKNLMGFLRNRIKTASKGFRKYEYIDKRLQNTERKTNSILSPWATDSYLLPQTADIYV